MSKWVLLVSMPLCASQGYRYVPVRPVQQPLPAIYDATKLKTIDDVLEYQSLLYSCRVIKQNIKSMQDHRMSLHDALQTSVTLFLQGVKSEPAKVLLEDLKANGFAL